MDTRTSTRIMAVWTGLLVLTGTISNAQQTKSAEIWEEPPWCNKYCMSLFMKARTSKILGKGHYSLALKTTFNDFDEFRGGDGEYHQSSVF
ncbi:MAG: hypothetical protein HN742_06900 [Lentisphaerae bacterium]|nr:hypothetical protein [Lentisphaerota bacterium]MBT4821308.1 hypothetical protein [Lentisphaerota bacterium]MBT5612849.1 hypothetical protein [Lentisphaerota bacterium]MBT7059695.1 hypothetical protein [Lentisphaerota bacterium]MBT7841580.1 hypothetical protein [Lentisphaerota bacterium]